MSKRGRKPVKNKTPVAERAKQSVANLKARKAGRVEMILEEHELAWMVTAKEKAGVKTHKDLMTILLCNYLNIPYGSALIDDDEKAKNAQRLAEETPAAVKLAAVKATHHEQSETPTISVAQSEAAINGTRT
ncbi:MAG: hypothetical protein HRT35_20390, partial [Algicola sp.]|nr:hypothetical protein [Algicola sp.]